MAKHSKKERFEVPGTIVKCQSGRYLAYYEHRTDIIANGENETDAKKNLKKLYESVIKHEQSEEDENAKKALKLPKKSVSKSFTEKLHSIR